MSLIDKTYFVGELDVANTNNANVEARLQWFINKYEPEFLRLILGADLYTNYVAGIVVTAPDPVPAEWVALQDFEGLKTAIASYVYFYYMRDQFTQTVGLGEVKPTAENATASDPSFKMMRAINEAVRWVRENTLVEFLNENVSDYPGWVMPESYTYYSYGVLKTTSVLFRRLGLYVNPVLDL